MKKLFFISFFFLLFASLYAQTPYMLKSESLLKKLQKSKLLPLHPGDPLPGRVYALNQPEMKFLFKNDIGRVYESNRDRMRILSPDFESLMPVQHIRPGITTMPNPLHTTPLPDLKYPGNGIAPKK